jgi:ribonucleotide monophosphatase NagD (HAD superfamily)
MNNTLHNITIWYKSEDTGKDEAFAVAVVAEDLVKAKEIGMRICLIETGASEEYAKVDDELSYEIDCAEDMDGKLFDIKLIPAS